MAGWKRRTASPPFFRDGVCDGSGRGIGRLCLRDSWRAAGPRPYASRTQRLDAGAAQERFSTLRDGHRCGRWTGLAVGTPPLASALPIVYVESFIRLAVP